jgi:hypothetical protein
LAIRQVIITWSTVSVGGLGGSLLMQMAIHRLNHKISFGTVKSTENDMTGDYDTEFVPDVTVHCAMYQRTETKKFKFWYDLADTIVL